MAYEVTIGIPVYNVEKYIRLTMDSALAQTFPSIEFLVLDDCGTDCSMEIVREYQQTHPRGKNIRIVRQPQNGGLGCARNRIIEEAQGKYLYHLDADDAIAPNTISLLYDKAKEFDADIVYGSYKRIEDFDGVTKETDYLYSYAVFLVENQFADYVYDNYGIIQANTWNFLIKTEIYIKNNIRHKAVNFWEDFSTTISLPIYITKAVLLPNITYYYYCRFGSLSNFNKRSRIEKSEIDKTINAMREVKQDFFKFKNKPYFHKWLFKVMMTHFYMICAILKNDKIIFPKFSKQQLRDVVRYPLSYSEILRLRDWRLKNFLLSIPGMLPVSLSITIIKLIGKKKNLI